MPQAAECSGCGTNVYLTPEGGCPRGHGPECLSGHYDVPETAPLAHEPLQLETPESASGIPHWVLWVAGTLVLGLILFGGAITYVTYTAGQAVAQEDECFQTQFDIEDAAVSYAEQNGELPDRIEDMVPDFLHQMPTCPSGGAYSLDATLPGVDCSKHGNYADCFT